MLSVVAWWHPTHLRGGCVTTDRQMLDESIGIQLAHALHVGTHPLLGCDGQQRQHNK